MGGMEISGDLLLFVIMLMVVALGFLLLGAVSAYFRGRATHGDVTYCEFPGCIKARRKMRALVEEYPGGIPPHLLIDVIEEVEAGEHGRP